MTTFNRPVNNTPTFSDIRKAYEWFNIYIFERFKETKCLSRWVSPYLVGFDFMHFFSPIEFMTWQALRSYGHAPFYPQYPVGKYFLDFGNPIVKVGIECDGKEFHTDKQKDFNRDMDLYKMGWTIYRISGSDCNRIIEEYEYPQDYNEDEVKENRYNHIMNTIEGLIESLGIRYFHQMFYGEPDEILPLVCKCLRNRISVYSDEFDDELSTRINECYNKYYETTNTQN